MRLSPVFPEAGQKDRLKWVWCRCSEEPASSSGMVRTAQWSRWWILSPPGQPQPQSIMRKQVKTPGFPNRSWTACTRPHRSISQDRLAALAAPTFMPRKRPPGEVAFFVASSGGRCKDRTCDTCRVKVSLDRRETLRLATLEELRSHQRSSQDGKYSSST